MKNKIILSTIFILFLLAAAIYAVQQADPCKDKNNCFMQDPDINSKINSLLSLNIGGLTYKDLEDRSIDIPVSISSLYEEATMFKTLAEFRSQYEGISQEALKKEELQIIEEQSIEDKLAGKDCGEVPGEIEPDYLCLRGYQEDLEAENYECLGPCYDESGTAYDSLSCCTVAETEPEQTAIPRTGVIQEEKQLGIESYEILLNDNKLFSRDYIVRFKDGEWQWCKNPLFGSCANKDYKTITANSPAESDAEEFYKITSALAGKDYDTGLEKLLKKLVFLRLGTSKMEFKVNEKSVKVEGSSARLTINIAGQILTVSGEENVTEFITIINPLREEFNSIFMIFRSLVTKKETVPGVAPSGTKEVKITVSNQGKTADQICTEGNSQRALSLRRCVVAGGQIINISDLTTFGNYITPVYPCGSTNPSGTVWDAVICE